MATVVEALGGVLSGGLFGSEVPRMKSFGREPLITSAFYLAINPEHFMPLDEFRGRIDRLVRMVKASERARGVDEVFLPGELEFRKKARASATASRSPAWCTRSWRASPASSACRSICRRADADPRILQSI